MGGGGIRVEVVLLDVLATVALVPGETEGSLFQDGIATVPQGNGEAQALPLVADLSQPILAPAIRARTSLVVVEVLPRGAVSAVGLSDGAPRALAQVGAPSAPVLFSEPLILKSFAFWIHTAAWHTDRLDGNQPPRPIAHDSGQPGPWPTNASTRAIWPGANVRRRGVLAREGMPISLKRAYDAPSRSDGCRILVERHTTGDPERSPVDDSRPGAIACASAFLRRLRVLPVYRSVLPFRQPGLKSGLGIGHHLRPSFGVNAAPTLRVDGEIRVQLAGLSSHVIVQEEIGGVELLQHA